MRQRKRRRTRMMRATVQMMPEPAVDAGETADAAVRTHAMYIYAIRRCEQTHALV